MAAAVGGLEIDAMTTLQHCWPAFDAPRLGGAVLALFLLGPGAACAEDALADTSPASGSSSEGSKAKGFLSNLSNFAAIDMGVGADMKPHRSLRIRFDGATRAMRSFGLEAQDCATVVRSIRPAADVGRLGVSVGLNCKFF